MKCNFVWRKQFLSETLDLYKVFSDVVNFIIDAIQNPFANISLQHNQTAYQVEL